MVSAEARGRTFKRAEVRGNLNTRVDWRGRLGAVRKCEDAGGNATWNSSKKERAGSGGKLSKYKVNYGNGAKKKVDKFGSLLSPGETR